MNIQKCQQCKETRGCVINSTWKDKKGDIRYYYRCLICLAEAHRAYRKTEKGNLVYRNLMAKQYLINKHKVSARQTLNYHLRNKNIQKPEKCSKCKMKKKIEAHHEDYSQPLNVVWLCRQCHCIV